MSRLYPAAAYDPAPDPGNYYLSTVTLPPAPAPLEGEAEAEVAVIGAGYTGLSAALQLAEKHQVRATVVDAAFPGWGASGRNGGFVCLGGSKASTRRLIARHGEAETRRFFAYQAQAIDQVMANLADYGIGADVHSDGEWVFAHRPRDMADLAAEAEEFRLLRGVPARIVSQDELKERGMFSAEFHGGLHKPLGCGFNPLKYVLGLAKAAESAGVTIHGNSPVTELRRDGGHWLLATPKGRLKARKLIFAGNGYSDDSNIPALGAATLPVFSNILVTRPLAQSEQAAQGWTAANTAYDTRHLLHYWRLMPDGRMLFGARGGTGFSAADRAVAQSRLRADFDRLFPAWTQVETAYFWSGLVCLTRDLVMKTGAVAGLDNVWASLGCQGSGVTMCSLSGRRVADLAMGVIKPQDLPAPLSAPLRRFPVPALRRWGLKAAYRYYSWLDA